MRIRPAMVKARRLLVLIHGLTGDENSMWVFVRNLKEDYWIIAPRAPYNAEHPAGGFSWQKVQTGSPGSQDDAQETSSLEDLRPAAEALIALIDLYATENNISALAGLLLVMVLSGCALLDQQEGSAHGRR